MKLSFKGKSAIVTGASGGMGLATVSKLDQIGMKVLMLDIKEPPKKYLKKNKIEFKKIDLTNFSLLKEIINNFY